LGFLRSGLLCLGLLRSGKVRGAILTQTINWSTDACSVFPDWSLLSYLIGLCWLLPAYFFLCKDLPIYLPLIISICQQYYRKTLREIMNFIKVDLPKTSIRTFWSFYVPVDFLEVDHFSQNFQHKSGRKPWSTPGLVSLSVTV
jgi:hypothetical protein